MEMKKVVFTVSGILLLFLTFFSDQSHAFVNVSIGVNIPAYTFSAPPRMAVIPGTYAYSVADIDADIFFIAATGSGRMGGAGIAPYLTTAHGSI